MSQRGKLTGTGRVPDHVWIGGCKIDGKSRPCDHYPECGCGPRRSFPTSATKPVTIKR